VRLNVRQATSIVRHKNRLDGQAKPPAPQQQRNSHL
jgi:hypothetical protein